MRRFFLAFVVLVLAMGATLSRPQAALPPPPALVQILSQLQSLDDDSFIKVTQWARNGADTVYNPIMDYERDEVSINILDRDVRYAVLQWLRGNGRRDLYNLRVSDDQIGPQRPGADSPGPTPVPTPNPWREVDFGTATLGSPAPDGSNIAYLDGFGAARIDGTEMDVCVSFQNNAPKTATLVHYEFTLHDQGGAVLGTIPFDRKGTFSTGIPIRTSSFDGFSDSGFNLNTKYADNCVKERPPLPSAAIMSAALLTYKVTHVEYSDGTNWTTTDATPAAPAPLAAANTTQSPSVSMLPGSEQGTGIDDSGDPWSVFPIAQTSDHSNIELISGFAAVPANHASIDICVAFRNNAPTTATLIHIIYSMMGVNGSNLGDITFSRKGSFTTGTDIDSLTFGNLLHPRLGIHHGLYDNCKFHRTNVAPFVTDAFRFINYKVTRVEYADGSVWTPAQ